ncbi:MAG: PAS domain S-box protein [Deltaproteobacteria bacterium]|nr:PAS domain S-box protein [Deltaproteobacteria bacterium]
MKRIAATILLAVLLFGLIGFIAYKSYLRVEADMENRFNASQWVLAKHIGYGIAQAIDETKVEMMIIAMLPSIQKGDDGCSVEMEEVYNNLRGRIAFLYRLNREGEVTHCFPENAAEQIKDKDSGCNVCITAPIPGNGRSAGVIGARIELSHLIYKETESGMMQTGKTGYVWIIDDQGRFIIHPEDEFVGRDAFIVRKERAPDISFEAVNRIMREKMMRGKNGTDVYVSGWHREQRGKIKKLIAYAPFRIKDKQYSVALVTPASGVISLIQKNFRHTLLLVGGIILAGLFALLMVLNLDRRRMKHLERGKVLAKEIEESRDYLQNLLESADDLIYTVDITGNFTYLNSRIEDYGYRAGELMGKPFLTILTKKHHGERFKKTIREKVRRAYEVELKTRDGVIRVCRVSTSPLMDQAGVVTGLLATVRDITEREQVKAEIIRLKEYNEKIVAGIPSSLLVLDRDLNIKSANRAYRETRGIGDEDVVGENIKEVFLGDLLKEGGLLEILEDVMATRETRRLYEVKHASPDHPEKILNITVSGLHRTSEEATLILVIEDITERAELREGIREKNKELENFVYIVSHDLKSPIVSMQGFSSMLLNEYGEKLGDEGTRYIERIRANASRMGVLISDLLALSRVGRVVGAFKDVSSLGIVNRVCGSLESRMAERGIAVSISDDLPLVHCDSARIYQVFENLLTNAVKFTGVAEKPVIEIRHEDKGDFHQFCVKDNGIGVDKEYHRKIFEIFQRLNEIEDAEGTGIGLVIVERIVNNHGGKVWVESEKGMGAAFYFTLPGQRGHVG